MPSDGISIYFTIKDNASMTLSSIGDKTKALDKETQQLAQSYAALQAANAKLIERQSKLQQELKLAKSATKDAKKAFDELGDAASKDAYDKAKKHQEDLRNQLSQTNKALRENESIYKQNMETIRKGAIGSGGTSLSDMAKGLATGQIGQMAAASLGGFLSQGLSSAFGVPEASVISNTLSSAISGVTAGAIAGPLGMLVGGIVGAGSGLLSGYTEIQAGKDESFKEYYAGLYEDVNAATEEMLSSGSVTAGSREQTLMAFAQRLGGDEAASRYLNRVEDFSKETNYGYDEITGYSKLLMNSYGADEVFGVLKTFSDATAGLSLSSSDVESMISGLNRMRTTGKATTEYLNFFSERGVDVYSALSAALGVDKSSIAEMVSGGEISGEFAAQAVLDYMDSTFGGLSEELMGTYDAMSNNLEDIMTSIDAAGGEGYNEMRKEGLEADIEAFGGALGEAMAEMNRIYGENAAYLENLSGQYQREALSAVLMGGETTLFSDEDQGKLEAMRTAYLEAKEAYENGDQAAGIRMQQEVENAETLATAAYDSSDAAIALRDAELDQLAAIRENTAGLEAATTAYLQSVEKSKGATLVIVEEKAEETRDFWSSIGSGITAGVFGHAYGMERVPYDEYPALLHEGEQVLTAAEARSRSEPRVINISVTDNNFSGTDSDMADRVAETIVRRLEQAAFVAAPR